MTDVAGIPKRSSAGAVFVALSMALPAGGTATPATAVERRAGEASVIVQGSGAARAVQAVGGTITFDLPIVGGVAARVPGDAVGRLRTAPGVRAIGDNAPVQVLGTTALAGTSTVNSVFAREVQADLLWAEGVTGEGITVALVDTGVTAVPDLAGRIVGDVPDPITEGRSGVCANFAGDGTCNDQYGHGTFLAGLIAGNGASSAGTFRGVAPKARIVSVKIAGRDGSSDVSKVLAAIQYVVTFRDELGIDVLNLSLGTDSTQSHRIDPLNYAVQRAWQAGITVVVAAGNRGVPAPGRTGTISKPADDPFVITVGSVDDRETPATSDDRVPNFSSRGPTALHRLPKPDVTAPGGRLVSLRSHAGSYVETEVGGGIAGTPYRRGSGTSMSAAVVSGVAALVLDANDGDGGGWSPDRVKHALAATATKVALSDPNAVGAGLVQAHRAARLTGPGLANVGLQPGNGSGSLDESRGSVRVTRPCSELERQLQPGCTKAVVGDETGTGVTYDGSEYADPDGDWDSPEGWYQSQWAAPTVLGTSWYDVAPEGTSWYEVGPTGTSWYGTSWYGTSWYGTSWYGTSWYGSSWEGGAESSTGYGKELPGSASYGAWQ